MMIIESNSVEKGDMLSKIAFAICASHEYRPQLAKPLLCSILTVPDSMLGTEYHWSASSRHRRATPKE